MQEDGRAVTISKIAVMLAIAWIGMAWPIAWSGLLMLISLSLLCLGLAADRLRIPARQIPIISR